MKFKVNFFRVGLWTIIIFVGAFIYNYQINLGYFPKFFYLDPQKINIENLMFYTWQVQVTLALISISLTSLILGRLEERCYGIMIKEILVLNRSISLTYIEKIFMVILLGIINLWFIIYGNLPILMWVFVMSSLIILWLIYDTINILINPNVYEKEIKGYINNIIMISSKDEFEYVIDNIKYHNEEMLKSSKTTKLRKNIYFLLENLNLFNKDTINQNSDIEQRGLHIEQCYEASLEMILEYDYIDLYIENLSRVIDKSFIYKDRKQLINILLNMLIHKVRENNSEEVYSKIYDYILYDITKNIDNNEIEDSYISSYIYKCFYGMYNNNTLNLYTKQNTIDKYIGKLIPSYFTNIDQREYFIRKLAIYYIIKPLINTNDISTFNNVINEIYNKNAISLNVNKDNQIYEIITTINIFIYYSVCVENLYENEYKDRIKGFLTSKVKDGTKYTKSIKDLLEMESEIIWNYYKVIKNEMPKCNWEYMPNGHCKALVIESSIDEFYLFYTIMFIDTYYYSDIIEQNIDIKNIITILEYFSNNGAFISSINDSFNQFKNMYNENDENTYKNKIYEFYILLNRYYVKLVINQEQEYKKDPKVIKNQEKIKNDIILYLKKNELYELTEDKIDIFDKEYTLGYIPISNSVLSEKVQLMGRTYQESVVDAIENTILNIITDEVGEFEYTYRNSDKIEEAIYYFKEKDFKLDSIINNMLSDSWYIKYEESDNDINKLKELESLIKNKYTLGSNNIITILFEKQYLDIKVEITKLEISDIDEESANKLITSINKVNQYYKKRVVNNIELLFTENEMIEYLMSKDKMLDIRFKISFDKEKFRGAVYKNKV